MPVNGYTVGRDVQIVMNSPTGNGVGGTVIPPDQITSFDAKPMKKEVWARPLNSPPQPIYMPDGWKGTIEVDRMDATLDTYQATIEGNFWQGTNTASGIVTETITEENGNQTVIQYNGCMFWVEDPGSYKADGNIVQRVEFSAGERKITQSSAA